MDYPMMEYDGVLDVLDKALELLSDPDRWTKGTMARVRSGRKTQDPFEPGAVCWCLSGAILRAAADVRRFVAAEQAAAAVATSIELVAPRTGIVTFNDLPETTHADVVAALERAIWIRRSYVENPD